MKKQIVLSLFIVFICQPIDAADFIREWYHALKPEYWPQEFALPARYTKQKYKIFNAPWAIITSRIGKKTMVYLDERGLVDQEGNLLEAAYQKGRVVNDPLGIEYGFGCISDSDGRITVLSEKYIVSVTTCAGTCDARFDAEGRLFLLDKNQQLIPDNANGVSFMERGISHPKAWSKGLILDVMYRDAQIDGSYAEKFRTWKLKYVEKPWRALWAVGIIVGACGLIKAGYTLYKKYKNKKNEQQLTQAKTASIPAS